MKKLTAVIDSNLHSYLVQAMSPNYDPASDNGGHVPELIAVFRCFFYTELQFYITPTVEKEYLAISDSKIKLKDARKRLHDIFLLDLCPTPNATEVNILKDYYLQYHNGENDCKILAEAEIGGKDILLTNDNEFYENITGHEKSIKLMKATDFWKSQKIPKDARPIQEPTKDNPLYGKSWWRW